MKKVLHYVSIMNRAGQETFLMNVFREINRDRVCFDFLCSFSEKGDYDDEIHQLGGTIHHIQLSCKKGGWKQFQNFLILYKYLRTVKTEYTAFHIHTSHAMNGFLEAWAAKIAGIPKVIVHSHNTSTPYHIRAHKLFRFPLRVSPFTRFACSHKAGIWLYGRKGSFRVICNGIDTDKYCYSDAKRQLIRDRNNWNDKLVIGHVGRFTYQKNHEFIITIFSKIHESNPHALLVLAGCGELEDSVREQVANLNLTEAVQFLGTRPDVDMLNAGFDLFLFPSRYEGLPVVLVEAQSTGLPCLISSTITPEIDITQKIYRMDLTQSSDLWAERALEILEKNKVRKDMGETIKKAGYAIADTAGLLEKFYCS